MGAHGQLENSAILRGGLADLLVGGDGKLDVVRATFDGSSRGDVGVRVLFGEVQVRDVHFAGHRRFAVDNNSPVAVNAPMCWWGHPAGPTPPGAKIAPPRERVSAAVVWFPPAGVSIPAG